MSDDVWSTTTEIYSEVNAEVETGSELIHGSHQTTLSP